jgi:hypothetical protein
MTPHRAIALIPIVAFFSASAIAQPVVPPGFTARKIAPLLDGQVPELSAIDDPGGFGTGVLTAVGDNGLITVRLLEPSGILHSLGTFEHRGETATVRSLRFGSLDGSEDHPYVMIVTPKLPAPSDQVQTTLLRVQPDEILEIVFETTVGNGYAFDFVFTTGIDGFPDGAVVSNEILPSLLGSISPGSQLTIFGGPPLPDGRTDLDIRGWHPDPTGKYGGGILIADTDPNNDNITAIYELEEAGLLGGVYRVIGSEVPTGTLSYGDLAIAATGDFGGVIYVTETLTDEIQQVAPDGTHTTWATGFNGIDSLSITPDGSTMYVGDLNGVWIVRATGNEPGPVVLATDPSVPQNSQLTGNPVTSFRIIFNEPVSFTDDDVTITNANGDPVGFDASGSASQFMLIGLAEPLFGDTYTVTIADTVTSVTTGEPLDGDNDGFSGGDAVLTFTHRCPGDFNGDGIFDFFDVLAFLDAFSAGCP